MKFTTLSLFFEKIEQTSSRLTITHLLADLFKKLNQNEMEKTIYLLQGRIAPLFEKTELGIAEKMGIKSILSALNLEKKLFENKYKQVGDLGKTVEYFKKEIQSLEEKDLMIREVFDQLYKLATASGEGSQEVKLNILANLIRQVDPLSSRYLVRISQGIMRLGFSDMTVLDAFSWMIAGDKSQRPLIERAYHVRPDLGYIGEVIKEKGMEGLKNIKPKIFTPILMMKAERLSSASEILEKIGKCAVEEKFDGFRLQAHYKKFQIPNSKSQTNPKSKTQNSKQEEVRLYSRNLEDATFMYPDIVEGIKKEIKTNEIIFEGEAIGFDPHSGNFLPFQETVQRKRKYDIEEKAKEIPLKLFAFELLYCDGINYIHSPYTVRRKILEKSIKVSGNLFEDTVVIAPEKILNEAKSIEMEFENAITKGLEGIIAKKLDGIYQPGARGWNWIKFKRSYSSKIKDTIDCLVMGYDLGKGKRVGFGIGAFLAGVYDEKQDKFVTVAKVGTGLSDEEWRQLKVQSSSRVTQDKVQKKPSQYEVDKTMECDVWITPSIVVEIRADEITRSPVHTAGFALRFPRLERFRDDKRSEDVTTLTEIEQMFQDQKR